MGHRVTTAQLCHSVPKAPLDNMHMNKCGCVPVRLYGYQNLNFISFSHVTKYSSSTPTNPLKMAQSFLAYVPCRNRQWAVICFSPHYSEEGYGFWSQTTWVWIGSAMCKLYDLSWASYLTSLCLSFLSMKWGSGTTRQDYCEGDLINEGHVLNTE